MGILLKVLFWQAVIITIIVVVLKRTLDRLLTDAALRCLSSGIDGSGRLSEDEAAGPDIQSVTVVSHKPMGPAGREKFNAAARQRGLPPERLRFETDRMIKGGIVLRLDGGVQDFSVRSRWAQAFGGGRP